MQATSFGAHLDTKISRRVTHLVVSANRTRTQKVRQAARYPGIKIVKQQWLTESMSRWEKVDEGPYMVRNFDNSSPSSVHRGSLSLRRFSGVNLGHGLGLAEIKAVQKEVLAKALSKPLSKLERAHQRRKSGEFGEIDNGMGLTNRQINVHRDDRPKAGQGNESDFSEISRNTSGDDTTDGEDGMTTDGDADAPSELEDGKSPIEGLQNVDWSELDDELKDFMGESGDDSDEGSVTSRKIPRPHIYIALQLTHYRLKRHIHRQHILHRPPRKTEARSRQRRTNRRRSRIHPLQKAKNSKISYYWVEICEDC